MSGSDSTSIPYGYCECGCGEKTSLAPQTSTRFGWVKDEPVRFIRGHANRRHHLFETTHDVDPQTGCWIWNGVLDQDGYAQLPSIKQVTGTHRAARAYYEHYREPIPAGLVPDHLCRNRACVNPDHLEPVTHAVNSQRGKNTKLDPERVRAIRSMRNAGHPLRYIAERFGVSIPTISEVASRRTWKNIP